jgi:hypothetical protein
MRNNYINFTYIVLNTVYHYLDFTPQLIQVIFKPLIINQNQLILMSDHEYAPAGGTDMQQHALTNRVNLFLFDLRNEASEHGLKSNESWTLELATEDEMSVLRKAHHPVISIRLQPQALLSAFREIKTRLHQSFTTGDISLTASDLTREEKRHLAAYPATIRK